jgi:magnesium-transporting ATPase (P-type)
MAMKALRTISMGYKDISHHEYKLLQSKLERAGSAFFDEESKNSDENSQNDNNLPDIDKDLTLVAVFGIRDVIRAGIRDAVARCS